MSEISQPVLSVKGLHVGFEHSDGFKSVVQDVSFDVAPGTCVAIVGESGSGKSVTARSVIGLTGKGAQVTAKGLLLGDTDLSSLTQTEWRHVRGNRIGFVLQDALVSLDPLRPVGKEIEEALSLHNWGTKATRKQKVIELLNAVGVPHPERRAGQRPDELSGGLRQRALIASAIALSPELVIADEPTTALDVTVQLQVLQLLEDLKRRGSAIVLISHDLSVVSQLADQILVMTGGRVVEQGIADEVLERPQHPYTQALLDAVPGTHTRGTRLSSEPPVSAQALERDEHRISVPIDAVPAIVATDIVKSFPVPGGGTSRVVDGVSFTLRRGETLGIVGESGSGKSTTARIALGLETADSGNVQLLGHPWSELPESKRRDLRKHVSVVPQDPLSSFDPRWTVERILADAIALSGVEHRDAVKSRAIELVNLVGLDEKVLQRFPLGLSGGQRQRVSIARALANHPDIIVLDEAVSALDVSVQARVLDLLSDLQERFQLAYLFVSHDLGVIRHISDQVVVMTGGRIVEAGPTERVFNTPDHPYTAKLVAALPGRDFAKKTVAAA